MSRSALRRRLLLVWLVLAGLIGAIGVLEYGDRLHAGPKTPDFRRLVPVPVEQLAAVEIAEAGRLHRFERDAAGTWFYHGVHTGGEVTHTHQSDPAIAARVERAIAAFGRTRIEREFPVDRHGTEYGVAPPEMVVLLYRSRQTQPFVQYAVGSVAPDTASRYVMAVGSPVVMTIAKYQIDNLKSLIATVAGGDDRRPGGAAREGSG